MEKANIVPIHFYLLLKMFVRDGAKIFAWSRPNAEVHVHTVLGDSDVNCKQGAMISSILYLYLILDDRPSVCGSKNTSLSIHHLVFTYTLRKFLRMADIFKQLSDDLYNVK